jgi:N-methylhydantoinase A
MESQVSGASQPVMLGVDVGGTFTDAVMVCSGRLFRAKVPTTRDQSEGVLEAARRVIGQAGLKPRDVDYFAHGMTTATNALLEHKGAHTVSVSTAGFRDIIEIGRQNRPCLYDLCPVRPETLIPDAMRLAVSERVAPGGVELELTAKEMNRVVDEIRAIGPEAVAVCLLFSFMDPSHEFLLGELIRRELPHVHVSLSSEVLPQFREYERFSTTAVDAYLTPVVARYLLSLKEGTEAAGLPQAEIMQSSGGVLPLEKALKSAAPLLLSGPAAGVVGSVFSGARSQVDNLIAFDMGGTSTDVTLIREGEAGTTNGRDIGGVPVALPMVDIHTIGAGGGSVAWIDAGGALRVGPQSAGAQPGPACYGHGGVVPTVTDANLCLGYLGERLGGVGGVALDEAAAKKAVSSLAVELGISVEETSLGIRRVANSEMLKALRVISVERGHDPRQFALAAFGGAGPMHGADLADELGIGRVLVPDGCGVLSALGLVVGDRRRDWVQTVYAPGEPDSRKIESAYGALEIMAASELLGADFVRRADLRYKGQSHELTVLVHKPLDIESAVEAFEDEHMNIYGYRAEDGEVELVNIRLTALVAHMRPTLDASAPGSGSVYTRQAYFGGHWHEAGIWRRDALGTQEVPGPAVIEEDEATTVVPPGWRANIDKSDNLWLERIF